MLDFSSAPINPAQLNTGDDADTLRRYLVDTLESWLPSLLREGKAQFGEFRCGSVLGERGGSFSMRLTGPNRGLWTDHSSGEGGDVFELLMKNQGVDFAGAMSLARDMSGLRLKPIVNKPREKTKEDHAAAVSFVLAESKPIDDSDAAWKYLRGRGINRGEITVSFLRARGWLPHHPSKSRWPAMLGEIRDIKDNVIGVHRTYLQPSGEKAPVDPNKMMLGLSKGGSVHLSSAVNDVLGVAEGIETGLSAQQMFGVPVWAALSTSGMAALEIPKSVKHLFIFADNDPPSTAPGKMFGLRPGSEAARALARRVSSADVSVEIVKPEGCFKDFNDQLLNTVIGEKK